ncbi:acyltransferase, partial [Escherichia coli]
MKHKFLLMYSFFVRLIFLWLPDTPMIMRFRGYVYSWGMNKCGHNLQVSSTAVLRGIERISCGNDVYFGPNSYIMARKSIIIGDETLVAMNVVIVDANHGKENNSYRFKRGSAKEINIGRGVWIAANCVVTAGSTIKDGTLIPPCSVV